MMCNIDFYVVLSQTLAELLSISKTMLLNGEDTCNECTHMLRMLMLDFKLPYTGFIIPRLQPCDNFASGSFMSSGKQVWFDWLFRDRVNLLCRSLIGEIVECHGHVSRIHECDCQTELHSLDSRHYGCYSPCKYLGYSYKFNTGRWHVRFLHTDSFVSVLECALEGREHRPYTLF